MRMPSRRGCRPSTSAIPIRRPSTASSKYRRLWQDRQRRRADFHLVWPAQPYREDHVDPDRRLRDVAGGQARAALARGAGDRHRLQRDERSPHRGAQAEVRARQPRGPPASDRAGRRARRDLRSDRLHRRAPSPRRSRRGARGAARRARARRRDAPHGVRAVRTDRRLHAAGVLQAASASRPPTTGIRELVAALGGACRPDIRWRRCCARRRTSGNEAALADALLHPQDRAYSVPQLFELLERRGLTFGRWVRQAPYEPALRRHGAPPAARRGSRSFRWRTSYAAVELFRGTMLRHSVVAYRDDDRGRRARAQLRRRRLAALRADSAARHDLRRGAVAARRGRGADQPKPHVTPTSICRSTREEKRLFDAIDGARTIGEIAAEHGRRRRSRARSSSGSYWHDQVVFDASASTLGTAHDGHHEDDSEIPSKWRANASAGP